MRRFALLFGIAALAAGIWILVASMGTAPVPVGVGATTPSDGPESGSMRMGERAEPEAPSEATETGFERSQVEATDASTATRTELVRILVTAKETGEPVPGAEVAYIPNMATLSYGEMTLDEQEEYRRLARDQEEFTHHYGKTLLADSEGVAFISLEPSDSYTQVTGRHDRLYGQLHIRWDSPGEEDEQEYELELERDIAYVVQVLDSRGDPAVDVPIALVPQWEGETRGQRNFPYEVARSGAPDGMATLAHLQILLRVFEQQSPVPDGYLVRPHIPGLTEGGEPLDLQNPPSDPLVFQLPPAGRVVVETTDVRGRALPSDFGSVMLFMAPDDPQTDLRTYRPQDNMQWFQQLEKDGTTAFPWVVASKSYMTSAYVSMESLQKVFAGPLVEDQEVRVTLSLENEAYNVVGRVLDEDFQPLRNGQLFVSFEADRGSSGTRPFQTDEDGRFRIAVGRAGRETALEVLTIQNTSGRSATKEDSRMYTLAAERQLVPGDNDIGDVVLESAPLVAAGRILVDGVAARQTPFIFQIQRLEITQTRTTTRQRWPMEQGLNLAFLDEGRFEIRGVSRAPRYRLLLNDYQMGYLPIVPLEFVPGAEDLELDLETGGSLQAVVWMDEAIPLQNLWLQLVPTEGQDQKVKPDPDDPYVRMFARRGDRLRARSTGSEEGRHTFQWGALWPGGYRFEVLPRGASRPLVAVPDIRIHAGETNKDPRLSEIDLRGKIRKIAVKVVDVDGRAMDDSRFRTIVLINDPTAGEEVQGFGLRNGPAAILTADPYVDLLVAARGYRPKEVFGVTSDTTVMLEPFPEVVVKVAGVELPENHTLRASLRKGEARSERDTRRISYENGSGSLGTWLRPPANSQQVGVGEEVAVAVDGDGTYTVGVSVGNSTTGRSASIRAVEPAEVQVRMALGRQVFEIRIPEEEWKQALERAARR